MIWTLSRHTTNSFQMNSIYEVRDANARVGFVSFWHQNVSGAEVDPVRVQVMYWNRPDQSMTVALTTAWLERRLENISSQYMRSYISCWPIWGDSHYTVSAVPADYFKSVQQKYDDAGIGYMLVRKEGDTFTGYFPMPGGMYPELQVIGFGGGPAGGVRNWKPKDANGDYALYCWRFTCPPRERAYLASNSGPAFSRGLIV